MKLDMKEMKAIAEHTAHGAMSILAKKYLDEKSNEKHGKMFIDLGREEALKFVIDTMDIRLYSEDQADKSAMEQVRFDEWMRELMIDHVYNKLASEK